MTVVGLLAKTVTTLGTRVGTLEQALDDALPVFDRVLNGQIDAQNVAFIAAVQELKNARVEF
jgi:hypothetical protein